MDSRRCTALVLLAVIVGAGCSPADEPSPTVPPTNTAAPPPEATATTAPAEATATTAPAARPPILFSTSNDNPDEINIYSLDPETGDLKQLSEGFTFAVAPQWSPDYSRIAFSSNDGGSWRVYVMDVDGGNLSQVTDFSSAIPDWFPSGERLIFNSDSRLEPVDTPDLYAMNLDGSDLVEIIDVDAVADFDGHVSPQGDKVVFVSSRTGVNQIYVADIDGSNVVQLTEGDVGNYGPDISPDGEWILFTAASNEGTNLFVMRMGGSELTQLTELPGQDFDGAWSPDGEQIAFVSSPQQFPMLWLMERDGGNMRQLTEGEFPVIAPSWH